MEHIREGNVRELKHRIERALLLEESDLISEDDFDFDSSKASRVRRKVVISKPESLPPKDVDTHMLLIPLNRASLAEVQQMLAQKVPDHVESHRVKTAKIIGISRPRLGGILRIPREDPED